MPSVESTIVIAPRWSTLMGTGEFASLPLDVSQYNSAQIQVVAIPTYYSDYESNSVEIYLDESLDCESWITSPPALCPPYPGFKMDGDDGQNPRIVSYTFRLRWFRIRFKVTSDAAWAVTNIWAEGLLR